MELQFKKHVRVICDLAIGDVVRTDFDYRLNGKDWVIEDIRFAVGNCESGVLVKIDGYERYIDSNWFDKV